MKAHVQKQRRPQAKASPNTNLITRHTNGNQAFSESLQASAARVAVGLDTSATKRFAHDFSRIPISPRLLPSFQAKLKVNTPGDIYEREADQVSEGMIATTGPHVVSVAPAHIQHLAERPTEDAAAAPASVSEALAESGKPLEPTLRQEMEQRFSHDFSRVRVHSGMVAERSAKDVNAQAYTVGRDIVFGAGSSEGTIERRRLIAHELTHVVQQSGADLPWIGESHSRWSASALNVQRAPRSIPATMPTPPDWLGSWGAGAVHVQGDIWDIRIPSLGGDTWVGPYDQLKAYIAKQGFGGKMEAAHIVGGEHLDDIGSSFSYAKAPCIAVDKSLHSTWTAGTAALQSKEGTMGGRGTTTEGRPIVTRKDVIGLYDELYRGHPELRKIARNIVELPGTGANSRLTPKPKSTRPKPKSTRTTPATASPPTPSKSPSTKRAAFEMKNRPLTGTSQFPKGSIFEIDPTVSQLPKGSVFEIDPTVSQLPKGSVLEMKNPPLIGTFQLSKGSIFETDPIVSTPKVDAGSQHARIGTVPAMPTKAGPVANVGDAAPERVSQKFGPVTLDYDLKTGKPQSTVTLSNIDLSNYPPDREGSVTRFFKRGPALQTFVSGASLTLLVASLASEAVGDETREQILKVIEPIQSYFRGAIHDARTEFQSQFPDLGSLVRDAGIENYRKAYDVAAAKLRVPQNVRAFAAAMVAVTPDKDKDEALRVLGPALANRGPNSEDLSRYRDAGFAYEIAMAELLEQLYKHQAPLPEIADDIARRAAVLQRAGDRLEDAFWSVMQSPIAIIPFIYYEVLGIYNVSQVFQRLGANMEGFAVEITSRTNDYQRMIDSLDMQLIQVGNHLNDLGVGNSR